MYLHWHLSNGCPVIADPLIYGLDVCIPFVICAVYILMYKVTGNSAVTKYCLTFVVDTSYPTKTWKPKRNKKECSKKACSGSSNVVPESRLSSHGLQGPQLQVKWEEPLKDLSRVCSSLVLQNIPLSIFCPLPFQRRQPSASQFPVDNSGSLNSPSGWAYSMSPEVTNRKGSNEQPVHLGNSCLFLCF